MYLLILFRFFFSFFSFFLSAQACKHVQNMIILGLQEHRRPLNILLCVDSSTDIISFSFSFSEEEAEQKDEEEEEKSLKKAPLGATLNFRKSTVLLARLCFHQIFRPIYERASDNLCSWCFPQLEIFHLQTITWKYKCSVADEFPDIEATSYGFCRWSSYK